MVLNVGRGKARRVRRGGRTKKEAFSRCKIYDVQVSTRGKEGGEGGGRTGEGGGGGRTQSPRSFPV